ncbi:hypothetical protein OIU74_001449 [Salix koriyanagi]|uniref:Uncharacterized protein n=1 Tax=Salix koriyanagi TaxID=2511006 RepID=A0A9Q0X1C0_9ROSI|nr:hypothetical protein OIU74_001449 [Salix koriyanagi]
MHIRRYITTEELEQALRDFGMHDGRDLKEIISEVDADNGGDGKESRMAIYLCCLVVGGKAVGYAEAAGRNVDATNSL